jgi:hypothetical protein
VRAAVGREAARFRFCFLLEGAPAPARWCAPPLHAEEHGHVSASPAPRAACYVTLREKSRIGAAVHLRVTQRQKRPRVKCPLVLAERYWMSAAVSPGLSRARPRKSIAESTTKTTTAIATAINNAASSRPPS